MKFKEIWKVGFSLNKFFKGPDKEKKNKDLLDVEFNPKHKKNKNLKVVMKKSNFIILILFLFIVAAFVGGIAGRLFDRYILDSDFSQIQNVHIKGDGCSSGEAVALKAAPSVVGIRSVIKDKNGRKGSMFSSFPFRVPFPFFDGGDDDEIPLEPDDGKHSVDENVKAVEMGSGVIYEVKDGFAYIVTNFHVVKLALQNSGSSEIEVFFGSDVKKFTSANVVGYEASIDVAVLKVPLQGKKLKGVEIYDSNKLNSGQEVFVIGSPNGISFNGSITHGILSGLKRPIKLEGVKKEIETFQIDAPMNPGNSGGGIFDKYGRLIGICVAKMLGSYSFRRNTTTEGMGFCLPINAVNSAVRKIIDGSNGNTIKKMPTLGIIMESDSDFLFASQFINGVFVKDVLPGSVAERAKILPGDVIVEFDNEKIKNSSDLDAALSNKREKTAKVKVIRLSSRRQGYVKKILKVVFDD